MGMVFTFPLTRAVGIFASVIALGLVVGGLALLAPYFALAAVIVLVAVLGLVGSATVQLLRNRRKPGTEEFEIAEAMRGAYDHELAVQREMGTAPREARKAARGARNEAREAVQAEQLQRAAAEQAHTEPDDQQRAAEDAASRDAAAVRRRAEAEARVGRLNR